MAVRAAVLRAAILDLGLNLHETDLLLHELTLVAKLELVDLALVVELLLGVGAVATIATHVVAETAIAAVLRVDTYSN